MAEETTRKTTPELIAAIVLGLLGSGGAATACFNAQAELAKAEQAKIKLEEEKTKLEQQKLQLQQQNEKLKKDKGELTTNGKLLSDTLTQFKEATERLASAAVPGDQSVHIGDHNVGIATHGSRVDLSPNLKELQTLLDKAEPARKVFKKPD